MSKPTKSQRLYPRNEPKDLTPVMYQTWEDLLFIHWEVDKEGILKSLPEGLYPDTFNSKCFAAITPFSLNNLHFPFLPPFPLTGNFYETNIRTYVFNDDGIPGIWFYSLYANNVLAVQAARQIPLPYKTAAISVAENNSITNYRLSKLKADPSLNFEFNYTQSGELYYPEYDSLEFFLIERYFLFYSNKKKRLKKIQVNHQPYPLQSVEYLNNNSSLLRLDNINPLEVEPFHAIYSPGPGEVKIYFPSNA